MGTLGYRPSLDGLRGLAIAAVVAYHFQLIRGGFFGVDLFFVLSGFLITSLLVEERERHGRIDFRRFYLRRTRRLVPAVVFLLAIGAILGSFRYSSSRVEVIVAASLFYVANLSRAFVRPDPFVGTFANHLWSLAEEEQFYLVWPAALSLLLSRLRARSIVLVLLVLFVALSSYRLALALNGADWTRLYFGPDTHADGLVLGCAAAFAWRRGITLRRTSAVLLALGFVVGSSVVARPGIFSEVALLPLFEIAAAATILGALSEGVTSRILSLRPIVWLGKISYSLYLWHMFALWILFDHLVLSMILTVPLTLFSYYMVERRFRRSRLVRPIPAFAGAS